MSFFSQQRTQGRGQKLKLDAAKVQKIRARLAKGISQRQVAKEFGIGVSTVSSISTRQTWGHVS